MNDTLIVPFSVVPDDLPRVLRHGTDYRAGSSFVTISFSFMAGNGAAPPR